MLYGEKSRDEACKHALKLFDKVVKPSARNAIKSVDILMGEVKWRKII